MREHNKAVERQQEWREFSSFYQMPPAPQRDADRLRRISESQRDNPMSASAADVDYPQAAHAA
eukprot:5531219-Prorocentrum_lima.AAC.1